VSRFLTAHQHNGYYSAIDVGTRCKIQDRIQIKNTDNTETKHNPEKANNAKYSRTGQNQPGLVASYDTRQGNEVGLFYNAPRAHTGPIGLNHRRKAFCVFISRQNVFLLLYADLDSVGQMGFVLIPAKPPRSNLCKDPKNA